MEYIYPAKFGTCFFSISADTPLLAMVKQRCRLGQLFFSIMSWKQIVMIWWLKYLSSVYPGAYNSWKVGTKFCYIGNDEILPLWKLQASLALMAGQWETLEDHILKEWRHKCYDCVCKLFTGKLVVCVNALHMRAASSVRIVITVEFCSNFYFKK